MEAPGEAVPDRLETQRHRAISSREKGNIKEA
jgi:hypothetical protein